MDLDTSTSQKRKKGALLVGFASFIAAVIVAHRSPPPAYELSIYAGTPVAFWLGTSSALLIAVFVGLDAEDGVRRLAVFLGGITILAVTSLPVIRSYYFFGAGDPLTHLGWMKDIAAGELSVLNFLYPGTHTIAVFLADVTGMPLTRAVLVMVMAFTVVFLVFVPLTMWTMTRDWRATTLAALSAFLLLPLNNVSVFQVAHPTSQAILFSPLILYLLARYLIRSDGETAFIGTPTGVLMALTSVAVVLIHPQQAVNVILVFGAILGLQLLARWVESREADHSLLAFQTVFLVGVFLLWASRHERSTGASAALVNELLHGPSVGRSVRQRAMSLSALGGSFELLFLKLFLVSLIFIGLAALVILRSLHSRIESPDTTAFVRYFGLGVVLVFATFSAFLVLSFSQFHFRQLGFIMVLATLLGALAISQRLDSLSVRFSPRRVRTVAGIAVVLMLVLSLPTVFRSPYMYQASSHVTEAQMTGYETAIEHRGAPLFMGIRGSGQRWIDGVKGYEESHRRDVTIGSLYTGKHPAVGKNFTGRYIVRHYEDRYLAFTNRRYQQEAIVYKGLRFDRKGFRSLDATPGLNRVQANGGFQMYLINRSA